MPIESGQSLLHYRLVEKVGEGGMGVVWKAVDTTLDREAAVKILPDVFADTPERLARFEREAKLLAALNHPSIATVHGLHDADGVRFLAMEYVAGEDLAERLQRGALPRQQGLTVALRVAEALEAAHERGIVHRDLKPANIRVSPEGNVKVLDFGLARAFETDPASGEVSPTMSPTLTSAGTVAGVILGTAAYMSPEQARGHTADSRADVWAFGAVLYEILTGRQPFLGDTISDTLASVLKLDPQWDALPADTPHRIRRLLARCLQKDRKQRLHHIADARISLEETLAGVPDEQAETAAGTRLAGRERVLWAVGLLLAAVATGWATWSLRPAPAEPPLRKITLMVDNVDPDAPEPLYQKISPDGNKIAYSYGGKVYLRQLDSWNAREIAVGDGAAQWFWSPDGEHLAYVKDERLWRVAADGSGNAAICDLPWRIEGGTWGLDGTLVLASDQDGLFSVSSRGGELKEIHPKEEGLRDYHHPHFLPGDRGILVAPHRGRTISIALIADGKVEPLVEIENEVLRRPVYAPSGHVLYSRTGSNDGIWALPFSLDRLEATGEPFLVAAEAGGHSVSNDGTLVYGAGGGSDKRQLVWADRQGRILETIGQPQQGLVWPTLSPDGRQIAVGAGESSERDIWIHDVARHTRTRLTFDEAREYGSAWVPGTDRIAFTRRTETGPRVMITEADGSGEPETVVDGDAFDFSADGKFLLFDLESEETDWDQWYMALDGEGEAVPIIRTAHAEGDGRLSPDGGYIAYTSDESGRDEIYLKRFPSGEGKWQVSVDGGKYACWSPLGDELFWVDDGSMMAATVETGTTVHLGSPQRLFGWRPSWMLDYLRYDVSADAQRFVLVAPENRSEIANAIQMVENWYAEFEQD